MLELLRRGSSDMFRGKQIDLQIGHSFEIVNVFLTFSNFNEIFFQK